MGDIVSGGVAPCNGEGFMHLLSKESGKSLKPRT
jgi:hypothetical protein